MADDPESADSIEIADLGVLGEAKARRVTSLLRTVPDYPEKGIQFRDITGVLADPQGLELLVEAFARSLPSEGIDLVAGMEARGFLVGAPLALRLGLGFIPLRKQGKLPPPTVSEAYSLEYGRASLEGREGTIPEGARVLIVDDVIGRARGAARRQGRRALVLHRADGARRDGCAERPSGQRPGAASRLSPDARCRAGALTARPRKEWP